ncbi:MAG: ATP-binding protein [Legionellaceae bacterium]|nr:ATP-binding protein [Legionellaceae bacterium]
MKKSIRKFLLINLLLAISLTTLLTAIGNYYLDEKDIQEHLDTLMAVAGLSYATFLGDNLDEASLKPIQAALLHIPATDPKHPSLDTMMDRFSFELWSNSGQRLLHSPNAPLLDLDTIHDGFNSAVINHERWRIFSTLSKPSGSRLILAERYHIRNELARRIAHDDLYIMLLTFPLSGLLIWIIIGRGLLSIDRVAKEVAYRAPTHLEPVSLDAIPEEIKPMVDELNKLFFRLQEGFEREKRFASDAAHELKTPLAAIKTQAQVALNTPILEEKNTAITKLITSVNRSTHIVQQLLTMSRLVPDTPNITGFESVDLIRVTREILAMMTPLAIEKHADLEFQAAKNTPYFQGNTTAICILLRNLIDNAIRYTDEHGLISVRVRPDDGHVMLEVEDNGPGIPKELHTRVFERFFRVLGNKSSGSGLGLAIVKQICELHHARIELCTPQKHSGLIIRIYFPCCPRHGHALSNS